MEKITIPKKNKQVHILIKSKLVKEKSKKRNFNGIKAII